MLRKREQNLVYDQFESLAAAGVTHGIFSRLGGVSTGIYDSLNMSRSTGDAAGPVRENRLRMFRALGSDPARSVTSWLVHGNYVRVIDNDALNAPDRDDVHADGMITNLPGIALTMRYADCVPVLFADPERNAIGIAHAGWQGIENGVIAATVHAMQRAFGSTPHKLVAGIGPSIGPAKFEVGQDVAARIQRAVPAPVVINHSGSKPHVDLWQAADAQLHAAGVGVVECARECTASNTGLWFSHRAERGKTGRFGAAILLR